MRNTLLNRWFATEARAPDAPAVVEGGTGRVWTRSAVTAASARWAARFEEEAGASGVVRRRVAFSVPNGPGWFEAFLGILASGGVPVPIDPAEPREAQVLAAGAVGSTHLWTGGALLRLEAPGRSGFARPPAAEGLVKMTSGSTGAPRGLPVGHAQMAADAAQICSTMGIGPGDSNLAAIPLGYSYGLGNIVVPLLVQGTRVICASSPLPHVIAAEASRHAPTVFPAVPPLLRALASSSVDRSSLASIRLVISAGSPIEPEVARRFEARFGTRVHGFYGTSETGGIAFDRAGDATLEGRSVGQPLDGVRIRAGRSGRFTVSSAAVAGSGRFSPGDRARMNRSGELVLLGRSDRVVKLAGRRVDLAEVESALRAVPGTREAFAYFAAGGAGELCAAVAPGPSPAEVRRHLRSRVAAWKVPSRIITLPSLPMTSRGKTDSRRLGQLLSAPRTVTSISTLRSARQMSARR
jgi:acyl-coenzyme A synthetase/AMP-(fatty) acid ligase